MNHAKAAGRILPLALVDSADAGALDALRRPGAVNVIFGAGHVGGAILSRCREQGIPITAFCDNDPTKTSCCDLPVWRPTKALRDHPGANIIAAVVELALVAAQLAELGVKRLFTAGLLESATATASPAFGPELRNRQVERLCLSAHRGYFDYPARINPGVGIEFMITERCTLKCLDCANLMQYYRSPRNRHAAEVMREMDTVADCVDDLLEMRLIGGEPLLHPEFHLLASHAAAKANVETVAVITNGTVIPREEQWAALSNPKICFRISDYGDLSTRRDALIGELRRRNIPGYVVDVGSWNRWRLCGARGLPPEELRRVFAACRNARCLTVMNGRLYRCEHAANAANLGAMPDHPADYIDLRPLMNQAKSVAEARAELGRFFYEMEFIPACDYCPGAFRDTRTVAPAAQADGVLPLPVAYDGAI